MLTFIVVLHEYSKFCIQQIHQDTFNKDMKKGELLWKL